MTSPIATPALFLTRPSILTIPLLLSEGLIGRHFDRPPLVLNLSRVVRRCTESAYGIVISPCDSPFEVKSTGLGDFEPFCCCSLLILPQTYVCDEATSYRARNVEDTTLLIMIFSLRLLQSIYLPPSILPDSGFRLEPIIIVYTKEEAKRPYDRFHNFILASFWIGMEHREPEGSGNVKLVRIEMYSADDPEGLDNLKLFVNLLLDHGIDHETKFFPEPPPSGDSTDSRGPPPPGGERPPSESEGPHPTGYEAEMEELREMRKRGSLSEKEYLARRENLLKRWRKELYERLSK